MYMYYVYIFRFFLFFCWFNYVFFSILFLLFLLFFSRRFMLPIGEIPMNIETCLHGCGQKVNNGQVKGLLKLTRRRSSTEGVSIGVSTECTVLYSRYIELSNGQVIRCTAAAYQMPYIHRRSVSRERWPSRLLSGGLCVGLAKPRRQLVRVTDTMSG